MGLTAAESILLFAGAALVLHFLLGTVLPGLRRRFLLTADRRSADLREEFVPLAPGVVALGLAASAFVSGVAAYALTGSASDRPTDCAAPAA